jgi:hypothetical protein
MPPASLVASRRPRAGGRVLSTSATLLATTAFVAAAAAAGDPFVQQDAGKGVTIDWRRGTLVVRGVAAGDWRMPSAEMARAGAERRARNVGRARLDEALRALPLGGGRHLEGTAVGRAIDHARTVALEYQSNGGVELKLEVSFGDWRDAGSPAPPDAGAPLGAADAGTSGGGTSAPAPLALRLAEGSLGAAPILVVHGREVPLERVRYALLSEVPADAHPVKARADKQGRLVVEGAPDAPDLARREAIIYVQKVVR